MAQEMNLWTRLKSDSPAFFKRIIRIALVGAATITAVYLSLQAIPNFVVPDIITKIYSYSLVVSAVSAAIAKTTMSDASVAKVEVEKVQDKAEEKIQTVVDNAKTEIDVVAKDSAEK